MVIAGASERGPLCRLGLGTRVLGIVDEVDCSVLLAGRAHRRGCIQWLFGR